MSKINQLYAIADGYDELLVEAYDGYYDLELIDESAAKKVAKGIKASKTAKDAKDIAKEAKKLAKSDPKAAIVKYDQAIKLMKQCRKEAEDIEDDNLFSRILCVLAKHILICAVPGYIAAVSHLKAVLGVGSGEAYAVISKTAMLIQIGSIVFSSKKDIKSAVLTFINNKGEYKYNTSGKWYKIGTTRNETLRYFDNSITLCEMARDKLKEATK